MIVSTEQWHIDELSETISPLDRQEVWALGHLSPKQALEQSVEATERPLTGMIGGRVICICGLSKPSLLSDYGMPWLLGSSLVQKNSKHFLRQTKFMINQWKKETSIMMNFVDGRHKVAIRWLKFLGFTIHPAVPLGPDDVLFHLFTWTK